MTDTFTPGPYWMAADRVPLELPGRTDRDKLVYDVGAGDECLATFDRREDALLYRAAPAMLAALKPFAKMAEHTEHTDVRDGDVVMRLGNAELRKADFRAVLAAIAAAEGRG